MRLAMYGLALGLWMAAIAPDCAQADGGHHSDGRGRDERDGGHDKPHHPPEPAPPVTVPPVAPESPQDEATPSDEPAPVRLHAPPILGTPSPSEIATWQTPIPQSPLPTVTPLPASTSTTGQSDAPIVSRETSTVGVGEQPPQPRVEAPSVTSAASGATPDSPTIGAVLSTALVLAGVLGVVALWTVPALRPVLVTVSALAAGLATRCIR